MLVDKKFEKFQVKINSLFGGTSDCQDVYITSKRESCYEGKTSKFNDWNDGVVTDGGSDTGNCNC